MGNGLDFSAASRQGSLQAQSEVVKSLRCHHQRLLVGLGTPSGAKVEDKTPLPIYEKMGQDLGTMNLDLEAALLIPG